MARGGRPAPSGHHRRFPRAPAPPRRDPAPVSRACALGRPGVAPPPPPPRRALRPRARWCRAPPGAAAVASGRRRSGRRGPPRGRRGVTSPAAARGGGNARRGWRGPQPARGPGCPARRPTDRPADGAQPALAPRAVGVRGNGHAVGARGRRAGSSEAGGDPRPAGEGRASVRRPDGVGGAGALTGSADGLSGGSVASAQTRVLPGKRVISEAAAQTGTETASRIFPPGVNYRLVLAVCTLTFQIRLRYLKEITTSQTAGKHA